MDKSGDLLEHVAQSASIAEKLRQIDPAAAGPVAFSHVIESAQPFLVATLARKIDKTFWVLCPSVRTQELLYESLLNWQPNALFLSTGFQTRNFYPKPNSPPSKIFYPIRKSRPNGWLFFR